MELAPLGIRTTVIQPGAYGTGFGQNSIAPGDKELIESYGPVKQMFEGFQAYFQQMFETGSIGDPKEVVETYVAVVESAEGPTRVPIGADMSESLEAINGVCAQVQKGVRERLGMG